MSLVVGVDGGDDGCGIWMHVSGGMWVLGCV